MKARTGSAVVIALAIAGTVLWFGRRSSSDEAAGSSTPSAAAPAATRPPAHATRIDPSLRKQLAARIERGQAARAATAAGSSSPSAPSTPSGSSTPPTLERPPLSQVDLDAMKTPLMDALQDVIPLMKACWQNTMPDVPDLELRTAMFLTGDPDVGTLIDTQEISEASGKPLPRAFDDCIQDTLLNLELPPLREGDKAKFTTRITFSSKDDGK